MDTLLAASTPSVYTDFSGLAALRRQAQTNPAQSLEQVAGQFESIFMQMMLKAMRDATVDGGLFDSSQMDLYQNMFDQQVALDLSGTGGLGLAEMIVRQYAGAEGPRRASENPFARPAEATLARHSLLREQAPSPLRKLDAPTAKTVDWAPTTPDAFIRDLWEHAVAAAAELQLAPEVLVAQSALETGWGQHMIRSSAGDNSFNLFGIKAGANWSGETVRVATLEYRDGQMRREFAAFRAYPSLQASFADYVTFLQDQPRYHQALAKVSDSRQFLVELQAAGYATDPHYAAKIIAILERSSVAEVVAELKNSAQLSLSNHTALSQAVRHGHE